jgi:hypothetical protein
MFRAKDKDGKYLNITELRSINGKLRGTDTCYGTKENPVYAPSGIWYDDLEIYLFGDWRLVSELETKYELIPKPEKCFEKTPTQYNKEV